ncbi:MAG: hypothetical protein QXH03_02790 [Candidatus Bathyarchaeia archaeon]
MAEEKAVAYAKAIQIILLPITVVLGAFYILYQYFLGPLKQVESLWKQQYEDYVKELQKFAEEDNGNLTPEHQTILDQKTRLMQQTEATYVSITNKIYGLAELFLKIAFGVLAIYILPDIIKKWKSITSGQAGTAKGMSYIAICTTIENLAAQGKTLLASRLLTTAQTYFETVDKPFMMSEITRLQQELAVLTGWQYIYALFLIQFYTLELSAIPYWFTQLPPLPPPI